MQGVEILEQMTEYYQKRADIHDTLMSSRNEDGTEKLLTPILRLFAKHLADRNVLEIACGTGRWTGLIARQARSVVATDVNEAMLEKARANQIDPTKVVFRAADAYRLSALRGKYGAAFAADWWSHIPKSKIPTFVNGLHRRLRRGSPVVLVDMLPSRDLHRMFSHYDDEGNLIHKRNLPGDREYYVVKNFPTEAELRETFADSAEDIEYREHLALRRWVLTYKTR